MDTCAEEAYSKETPTKVEIRMRSSACIAITVLLLLAVYVTLRVTPLCSCFDMNASLSWKLGVPIPPYELAPSLLAQVESLAGKQLIGSSLEEIQETKCTFEQVAKAGKDTFPCEIFISGTRVQDEIIMKYWLGQDLIKKYGLIFRIYIGEDKKIVRVKAENIDLLSEWASVLPDSIKQRL